jgi:hypothetical protein
MRPAAWLFVFVCVIVPSAARAHEPLWGESPQTFAFGVWHPEVRLGWQNEYLLLHGSSRLDNPDALRRTRFDTVLDIQYAPRTSLNVRLEIPYSVVRSSGLVSGQMHSASSSGLGDMMLSAKSRFAQRFGEDWKEHQAYTVGLQLPTGAHSGREVGGPLLEPSEQPGSGKWGYMVGYAYAYERLQDTFWASAMYMGDLGGAGSKGDMATFDANYGYWVVRAHKPNDLGIVLATGPHWEWMGHDRLSTGPDPDSGYTLLAWQASVIATKGPAQFRIGALFPLHQHANGTQLRPDVQLRAGVEALF